MNCDRSKQDIGAWIDGELEPREAGELESHFKLCLECRDTKHQLLSLSSILRRSDIPEASPALRSRIKRSFNDSRGPVRQTFWQRIAVGGFVVPKPIFATLLVLALAGFWMAFQLGKINSSTVMMTVPAAEISNRASADVQTEPATETIFIEVPVVKKVTVVKTVYVTVPQHVETKPPRPTQTEQEPFPAFNSTSTSSGLSSDVDLKGFQPPAAMNARIIKEANNDEK